MLRPRTQIEASIQALEARFYEREELIRLLLLGIFAGENVLLIGPPGSAKSQLARAISQLFRDTDWFEYLLTRFTTPDEVFGPVSLQGLKQDQYIRQTEGFLPRAHFAFLDEIFKSGSSILNALLSLLNERIFYNGREKQPAPLHSLIAASNELPDDREGLAALYDRFLIRYEVHFLKHISSYEKMFHPPRDPITPTLTIEQIRHIQSHKMEVQIPPPLLLFLFELKTKAEQEHLHISDRRWHKIGDLWRTSAAIHDRSEVSIWDTFYTPHLLWNVPEELVSIREWFETSFDAALEQACEEELPTQRCAEVLARWTAQKQELYGIQFKKEMNVSAGGAERLQACRTELQDLAQLLRRALVRFHERERGRAEELHRTNLFLVQPAAAASKYVAIRLRGERVLYQMMELYRGLFDSSIPGVEYDFSL
jgi:MoxR-like ATPase